MTYQEAITLACVQMYCEGKLQLDDTKNWGFEYDAKYNAYENYNSTVEGRVRKLLGLKQFNFPWVDFCECSRKAIPLVKSPLVQVMK